MQYQYQKEHQNILNCPPANYQPLDKVAYRWVFVGNEIRNFQSQFEKNPKRFNDLSDLEKCEGTALSLFDTAIQAKDRFDFLKNKGTRPMGNKACQNLGTHIAEIQITVNDGVSEVPSDSKGHFNHHPLKILIIPTRSKLYNNYETIR